MIETINYYMGIVSFLGMVAFVTFSIIYSFQKERKERAQDADRIDDRVINLLKDQVAVLEKKVADQEILLKENTKKLEILISENKILRDVLQGKDQDTKKFQEAGYTAMEGVKKILDIAKQNSEDIKKLYTALNRHLKNIEEMKEEQINTIS